MAIGFIISLERKSGFKTKKAIIIKKIILNKKKYIRELLDFELPSCWSVSLGLAIGLGINVCESVKIIWYKKFNCFPIVKLTSFDVETLESEIYPLFSEK